LQHDLGYPNNDYVGYHNPTTRKVVDDQLLERMTAVCHAARILRKAECRRAADDIYHAVRARGSKAWRTNTNAPWD
jgi:hypothetical protein